jgi:hypothetical protein
MALLGYAVTNQFLLGGFDVRVSGFSQAGTLTSSHSVGVVDGVTLGFDLTQVDVLNGTSSLIDRNVVRQLATIQFVFREFSARNWRMALGQSVDGVVGSSYTLDDSLTSTPAGKTPYQTLQLVQQDRTTSDSYLVWDFWKVALDGGFEASINHTDFASASVRFRTFDVTDTDAAPPVVKQYPVFRYHKTTTI